MTINEWIITQGNIESNYVMYNIKLAKVIYYYSFLLLLRIVTSQVT